MSVYSNKKVFESPNFVNERGSHYVLEENTYQKSPLRHSEYVIYLDSHIPKSATKEVAEHRIEYEEKDGFWEDKIKEFGRSHQAEIEEIKRRILSECKIILEKELRNQASSFLIERTSLEKIIKEQQASIMEYQIKIRSFEEELEIWRIKLKEKEAYISKIDIEISAHRQGDEQTISDLRFHYEEMIKYQEDKFREELENQINNLKVSYEVKIKSYEKRIESYDVRFANLNRSIESLNQTILERNQEIDALQRSHHDAEHHSLLHETKLRQEFDKTTLTIRRDYEEKIKDLEIRIQKYDKITGDFKFQTSSLHKLEEELISWKKKCQYLETLKQKEVIKEVYIDKPQQIQPRVEREIINVDSKMERKWQQERMRLEEEIESYRIRIRDCEGRTQQAEQALYAKDMEIQRTYSAIEELQFNLREINVEVERIREENIVIMRDREKIVSMVKNYRRYLKELESMVSLKNQDLFQRIRELDLVISGEEFAVNVNVVPYGGKTQYQNQKSTVVTKTSKITSSGRKLT